MFVINTMKVKNTFNLFLINYLLIFSTNICNNCVKAKDVPKDKCIDCDKQLLTEKESNFTKTIENKLIKESFEIKTNKKLKSFENNIKKLDNIFTKISSNLSPIEDKLKESALNFLISLNLTEDCLSAVFQVLEGMKRTESWSYQFLDSSGKIPSGISQGVISSLGEYDQCLGTRGPANDQNPDKTIYGKYCLVKPVIPIKDFRVLQILLKNGFQFLNKETNNWIKNELKENLNKIKLLLTVNQMSDKFYAFYYGICIPSQCQTTDVQNIFKSVFGNNLIIDLEVGPKCDTINDRIEWNLYNSVVIIIPIILTILSILSTLYSLKYRKPIQQKSVYFHEILKSFSLIESNKRLFTPFKDRIIIVDLSMLCFVVWYSTSFQYTTILGSGLITYKRIFNSFAVNVLTENSYFWLRSVFPRNSLFLLSGIIISINYFNGKRLISMKSYITFAFENWYRFVLKMIGPMIMYRILVLVGDGPIYNLFTSTDVCPDQYWKNLLLFNNNVKTPSEMCIPPTWILSVIFQLHLLAPLFLVVLSKSFKLGLTFNLMAIIVFGFVKIIPKLFFGFNLLPYEISKLNSIEDMKQHLIRFFFFTDQYIYLFIVGIVSGYLLRKRQNFINRLTKTNLSIIIISLICYSSMIVAVVWSENFKDINTDKNQINLISWFVLGDVLWSSGVIWTIFLLYKQVNLNGLSSNRIFCAIIRLMLTNLVNLSILSIITTVIRRYPVEISHKNQIQFLYIETSLAIIASYLMYVLLEFPFIRLLEIFKNRRNVIHYKNAKNNININNNNNNIEIEMNGLTTH